MSSNVSRTIKKRLKSEFPQYKFSVRYKSYAGGDSVSVDAIDVFPSDAKKIKGIVDYYQGGYFNGMEDIYEYSPCDHETVKYTLFHNEMSELMWESIDIFLRENLSGYESFEKYEKNQWVNRVFFGEQEDSILNQRFWKSYK